MVGVIIGIVTGVAVAYIFYWLTASKRDAQRIERKLDTLSGQVTAYFDGLPESTGPVRTSYDAGLAAMEALNWDEAIEHFREAIKTAAGTQLVALFSLIGICHYRPARWKEAEQAFEESQRLAVDFKDEEGEATALNNLASLYQATNRLSAAEPLMKRVVEIVLNFTRTTGHPHPHLQDAFANYAGLLHAMGRTDAEILKTLSSLAAKYGLSAPL